MRINDVAAVRLYPAHGRSGARRSLPLLLRLRYEYGVITVLTCNWLLVGRVDDRVGWNTQRGDDTHMRFWKIENGNCATTTRPLKHPRTARRS
eukprot:scaffold4287_cov65-Phaeocystis_antarctica.AAC.7